MWDSQVAGRRFNMDLHRLSETENFFCFIFFYLFPSKPANGGRKNKIQKLFTLYSAWSSQLHHWIPVVQEQQRLLLVAGCNIGLSWCVCVSGLRNIWNTAHPLTLSHIYYFCLNPFFGLSCPAEGGVVLPTDVYIFCNHSHQKGLNSRPTPSRSFVQRQKFRLQNFTVQNCMVNWPPPPLQFPPRPPIVAIHQSKKVWHKQRPSALNANGHSAPLSPGKVNGTPPAPPLSLPLQHSLKEGSWLRPHVTSGIRWGHCPFHCTGGND